MKSLAVVFLVATCAAGALNARDARAAPLPITAAVYPSGAHLGYRPSLSNAETDCM